MIHIYTDGACSGNPGPGGWAYLIIRNGEKGAGKFSLLAENWGAELATTNNRMELQAVISALKAFFTQFQSGNRAAAEKVTIYTDSQYVQKGMTEWLASWKSKGWKTSGNKPVKNQDLWQCLDVLAKNFPIDWVWIKGHAGNEYNERCDALTQKAIASIT